MESDVDDLHLAMDCKGIIYVEFNRLRAFFPGWKQTRETRVRLDDWVRGEQQGKLSSIQRQLASPAPCKPPDRDVLLRPSIWNSPITARTARGASAARLSREMNLQRAKLRQRFPIS